MKRTYWLDLFTGATWDVFQKAGSSISGFRESRWKLGAPPDKTGQDMRKI